MVASQRTGRPDVKSRVSQLRSRQRPTRSIIAIDGEGKDDPEGRHLYTLLAGSHGGSLEGEDLSTVAILEWLLSLPSGLKCGFAIEYDINMWLRDLDLDTLQSLHQRGETYWNGYKLTWWHQRKFIVTQGKRSCCVWDVFRFFQKSFVRSLEEWNIGSDEVLTRIQTMKEQRGDFAQVSDKSIKEYCLEECHLLVQLVDKLLDTVDSVGLELKSYHGPGALASAALRKHGVKNHLSTPPAVVENAARYAYYGGRFETAELGIFDQLYSYDINSAYPAALLDMPCLEHARWIVAEELVTDGIYDVEWHVPVGRWGPFPFRTSDLPIGVNKKVGVKIYYPISGRRWVWGSELIAACEMFGPDTFDVKRGWQLVRKCEHRPFAFVQEYYDRRAELKAAGDFGATVLKLAINSLYGKTAQNPVDDRVPPYLSYTWAGMVTAHCRAQLLSAMRQAPNSIVAVATDGILSRSPLNLDCGTGLGQWSTKRLSQVFTLQNGVYSYIEDGTHKSHTRGYTRRDFDWDELRELWGKEAPHLKVEKQIRRFNGIGWSLMQKRPLDHWRRWTLHPRTIAADFGTRVSFDGFVSYSLWNCLSCRPLPVQTPSVDAEAELPPEI